MQKYIFTKFYHKQKHENYARKNFQFYITIKIEERIASHQNVMPSIQLQFMMDFRSKSTFDFVHAENAATPQVHLLLTIRHIVIYVEQFVQ